jgi:hypothetical protein
VKASTGAEAEAVSKATKAPPIVIFIFARIFFLLVLEIKIKRDLKLTKSFLLIEHHRRSDEVRVAHPPVLMDGITDAVMRRPGENSS